MKDRLQPSALIQMHISKAGVYVEQGHRSKKGMFVADHKFWTDIEGAIGYLRGLLRDSDIERGADTTGSGGAAETTEQAIDLEGIEQINLSKYPVRGHNPNPPRKS